MTESSEGATRYLKMVQAASAVGSMLGEGSLTMVISLLALVSSIASIGISFALYKKKTVSVAANSAAKTEDEEE